MHILHQLHYPEVEKKLGPTADRSSWRPGSRRHAVAFCPTCVQYWPAKYGLQFFGIGWGDGVASNSQLNQRQAHAPHV